MPRPVLLVDGSNIAYGGGRRTQAVLQYLLNVLEELKKFDFQLTVIVDAALRHSIDKKQELEALIDVGKILQAPAGRTADDFLLQLALKRQAKGQPVYILTNDMFPVKEAGGVIPRIAFMMAPMGDDTELIFIPPLESLVEHVHEEALTPLQPKPQLQPVNTDEKDAPDIPPELFRAFLNFFMTLQPPPKEGDIVAFTNVAGYLHNQFNGDFCNRFGLHKPKEFAQALEEQEYVKLTRKGLALYLVFQPKLFKACKELDAETAEQPPVTSMPAGDHGSDAARIQSVLDKLRQECHYPTEEKIAIKLHSMFPKGDLTTRKFIDKGLESKLIVKEKLGTATCYWPASGPYDAVDPDDPTDPYPPELYTALQDALDRLPTSQRTAQTRYHLARNLGMVGNPVIGALPQAKREHIVQRAVGRKMIHLVRTMMGTRFSVPIRE